jgi:tol-pal system beta propeller repeat protein TolB
MHSIFQLSLIFLGLSTSLSLMADAAPHVTDVATSSSQFLVKPGTHSKLPCLMLACSDDEAVLRLAKDLKFDIEFSDQVAIDLKKTAQEPPAAVIKKLFNQGTSLAMILKPTSLATKKNRGKVHVTIRDTHSNQILFDETSSYGTNTAYFDSHELAGKIVPALTGEASPFSGSLAYCKQYSPTHKVICMADVAGKREQVIVPNLTISVAPRWHTQAPVLFYSQFTKSNTRLMSVNVHNCKQRVICSYDGLNMQPSFSDDGSQVALCMSGKKGNTEIYLYDNKVSKKKGKRIYKQVTHNHGNNTSPTLLSNGDIIYCSDFQTGSPQIYYLDMKKHVTRRLSSGKGYCAAPSYHPESRSVVYTKLVDGSFQLFSLNIDDPRHREKQLTVGAGDKIDPAWSPCGRFVAFTYDTKDEKLNRPIPQIGILNCASKSIRIVTRSKQPKSFPTWINKPFYAT